VKRGVYDVVHYTAAYEVIHDAGIFAPTSWRIREWLLAAQDSVGLARNRAVYEQSG
jgi:hypothetical protein